MSEHALQTSRAGPAADPCGSPGLVTARSSSRRGNRVITDPVLRRRSHTPARRRRQAGPGRTDRRRPHHAPALRPPRSSSLARLGRATQLVVPAGAAPMLRRKGFTQIAQVDVDDEVAVGEILSAQPSRRTAETVRYSGRGPRPRMRPRVEIRPRLLRRRHRSLRRNGRPRTASTSHCSRSGAGGQSSAQGTSTRAEPRRRSCCCSLASPCRFTGARTTPYVCGAAGPSSSRGPSSHFAATRPSSPSVDVRISVSAIRRRLTRSGGGTASMRSVPAAAATRTRRGGRRALRRPPMPRAPCESERAGQAGLHEAEPTGRQRDHAEKARHEVRNQDEGRVDPRSHGPERGDQREVVERPLADRGEDGPPTVAERLRHLVALRLQLRSDPRRRRALRLRRFRIPRRGRGARAGGRTGRRRSRRRPSGRRRSLHPDRLFEVVIDRVPPIMAGTARNGRARRREQDQGRRREPRRDGRARDSGPGEHLVLKRTGGRHPAGNDATECVPGEVRLETARQSLVRIATLLPRYTRSSRPRTRPSTRPDRAEIEEAPPRGEPRASWEREEVKGHGCDDQEKPA